MTSQPARGYALRRRDATALAVALGAALLLAGCGSSTGPGSPPASDDRVARATRASQLLARFATAQEDSDAPALAVLPRDLQRQDGDWEGAGGENNKLAWLTGHLVAAGRLPASPGRGLVVDAAGRQIPTIVVSAQDALALMTADRTDCNGCTDLKVISARLTTMDISTSSGTATVPAWRFALKGTDVGLLRIALPETALLPMDLSSTTQPQPGDGLPIDSFTLVDHRTLRLHFTGAPDEPGPCGADYGAEQHASGRAVVVAVLQVPRKVPATEIACNAVGALRTVDIPLEDPLAARTVLSLAGGAVVPRD